MTRLRHLVFYWLPPLAWCGLIFLQSSFPVPEKLPTFPLADKVVHTLIYACLAFLFCRAFNAYPGNGKSAKRNKSIQPVLWAGFAAALLYGLSDEWHQSFVPSRTASLADLVADAIGSLLGSYVYAKLAKHRSHAGFERR